MSKGLSATVVSRAVHLIALLALLATACAPAAAPAKPTAPPAAQATTAPAKPAEAAKPAESKPAAQATTAPAKPAEAAKPAGDAKPAAQAVPPGQPMSITVTSALPATPASSTVTKWFGDKISERTNNRTTFRYQWGGALTKPGEELEGVKSGLADMGVIANVYYGTQLPLMNIDFAIPFAPADPKMIIEITRELYDRFPAMRKELEDFNQIPLLYIPLLSYQLYSRTPIAKPEDLNGKRLGLAPGKYLPQAFQILGASSVSLAAPEKYQAFQTGVIDADVLAWEYIAAFKLQEVAKHMIKMDLGGHFVWALTIRKDTWDKLTPEEQRLWQQTAREAEAWVVDEVIRQEQAALETIRKTPGVEFTEFSAADKAKWGEMMPNLPQQWADDMEARGLPGKEIMRAYLELATSKGHKWPRQWTVQ